MLFHMNTDEMWHQSVVRWQSNTDTLTNCCISSIMYGTIYSSLLQPNTKISIIKTHRYKKAIIEFRRKRRHEIERSSDEDKEQNTHIYTHTHTQTNPSQMIRWNEIKNESIRIGESHQLRSISTKTTTTILILIGNREQAVTTANDKKRLCCNSFHLMYLPKTFWHNNLSAVFSP